MKKSIKICIIIAAVVIILAGAMAGVSAWFCSSGIHTIGGNAHIELTSNGYILNESGEVLNEATLNANITTSGSGFTEKILKLFDSQRELSLTGFPTVTDDETTSFSFYEFGGSRFLQTSVETQAEGDFIDFFASLIQTKYNLYLSDDNTMKYVKIAQDDPESNDPNVFYFISADSSEDAVARFHELKLG